MTGIGFLASRPINSPESPQVSAAIALSRISPIPYIHGDRDVTVPVHHGRELYDAALEPKQLWIVPGAGHIQAMRETAQQDRLVAYLREALGTRP